jgi:hypothetical protein
VAGIAGVVLELLQHLSWRVGSLGAPEIDEDLFAQLPAILGVSERGGQCMLRELVSERASAATAMRSMSTPRRGSATRGIRKVGKASPSRGPPSGHSERQPNLNVLYFPFRQTTPTLTAVWEHISFNGEYISPKPSSRDFRGYEIRAPPSSTPLRVRLGTDSAMTPKAVASVRNVQLYWRSHDNG